MSSGKYKPVDMSAGIYKPKLSLVDSVSDTTVNSRVREASRILEASNSIKIKDTSKSIFKDTSKFNGQNGSSSPSVKLRRKTTRGDINRRQRSLSMPGLDMSTLSLVIPTNSLPMELSPEPVMVRMTSYNSKSNPLKYDNMYGYKDQYDNVAKHTEKGIEFCEKYTHFLKDRCAIEMEYAAKLKRLVKNYQPKKKEEEDYQSSCARGFLDMIKELHDLAGQHEVIAENTQASLIKELLNLIQELKLDRKKYLQEGSKVQEQLRNSLQQLDKSKGRYEKTYKEAEKALDTYRRADADINLSRAEVEKARNVSNGRSQECEKSKNEYASQLQQTNQQQKDFYTSQMPQVFQLLQELDERRTNKMKESIKASATIERNVIPIINTCIDGMIKASDSINASEDSKLVIDKYKSGFQIPSDIPFEDLSYTPQDNGGNNLLKPNSTPDNRSMGNKGGTIGKSRKQKGGLFGLFGSSKMEEQKEDFSDLPPNQRKKQLQKKLDGLKKDIARETAEREGMLKMKEVYATNPALGDPHSLDKKIEENAQKLDSLQSEYKKYQDFMLDAEGKMRRHSASDDSMSSGSVPSNVISAPGTPTPPHTYAPIAGEEETADHDVEVDTQDTEQFIDEFNDDYPNIVIGTCRALYPFEAVSEGSVPMMENEEMYVLEQDNGDGWTKVRKNDNAEGFVPTSYIQCHFYDQDAV